MTARNNIIKKGFTLVELLVVIAILGILVVGLIAAINPADKLNQATDAKTLSGVGVLARAEESYATTHSNFYANSTTVLVSSNELKSAPTGTYTFTTTPAACTSGVDCTAVVITASLLSSQYSATPFARYESSTGKQCKVATATTACP